MTLVYLTCIHPAENKRRFYRMSVEPTLFGEFALVREWGRIGRSGQVRSVPYAAADEAEAALQRMRLAKLRRGYLGTGEESPPRQM